MKNIIFMIAFLVVTTTINAQKGSTKSSRLEEIFNILEIFENTKNIKLIGDEFNISFGVFDNFNRKIQPQLWENNLNHKIYLSLQLINKLENYPNFDYQNNYQHQVLPPPCYEKVRKKIQSIDGVSIRLSTNPAADLSDFGDENCKQEYIKLLKENDRLKIEDDYQLAVNQLLFRAILELVDYFEHSKHTNIDEVYRFVSPLTDKYLDSERKIVEFNSRLKIAIQISEEQAILNKK